MTAKPLSVPDARALPAALDAELDEVLSLLPLIEVVPALGDRIFDRLTEALAHAVVHEVRSRHRAGTPGRAADRVEVGQVVAQLQERGLLTPPGPGAS